MNLSCAVVVSSSVSFRYRWWIMWPRSSAAARFKRSKRCGRWERWGRWGLWLAFREWGYKPVSSLLSFTFFTSFFHFRLPVSVPFRFLASRRFVSCATSHFRFHFYLLPVSLPPLASTSACLSLCPFNFYVNFMCHKSLLFTSGFTSTYFRLDFFHLKLLNVFHLLPVCFLSCFACFPLYFRFRFHHDFRFDFSIRFFTKWISPINFNWIKTARLGEWHVHQRRFRPLLWFHFRFELFHNRKYNQEERRLFHNVE